MLNLVRSKKIHPGGWWLASRLGGSLKLENSKRLPRCQTERLVYTPSHDAKRSKNIEFARRTGRVPVQERTAHFVHRKSGERARQGAELFCAGSRKGAGEPHRWHGRGRFVAFMAEDRLRPRSAHPRSQPHQAPSAAVQRRSEGQQELELRRYHKGGFSPRSRNSGSRTVFGFAGS